MAVKEKLDVYVGDITALAVDAVVNAANDRLAGGGGVDGAIHRAAGYEQLQAACRKLGGCSTGQVKVTPGFNLPAKYIFHAVGPVWHGGDAGEDKLLASCYYCAMNLAVEYGIQTIAFPAISCGVYGYPLEQAVNCAVETVVKALGSDSAKNTIKRIVFCCFDDHIAQIYREKLDGTFFHSAG